MRRNRILDRRGAEKKSKRGRVPRLRREGRTIHVRQGRQELASLASIPNAIMGIGWQPDIDGSSVVDVTDLLWVIGNWGKPDGFGGTVGTQHLLAVIAVWEADEPQVIGGELISPLVDDPTMEVLNHSIHSQGNCITRNNGGVCTITCDDAELVSQAGYGIYADRSTYTRLKDFHIESVGYYAIRGVHTQLEASDGAFFCPNHSVRLYGWREGFMRNVDITGEYFRCGGGAADEWVSPIETGGTPAKPIECIGGKWSLSKQLTAYNNTHDMVFMPDSWAGTTKIFIDEGARGIRIGGANKPFIDVKGQTQSQLQQRGIVVI